ncbi:MAG: 4Fe-4S binding protein [Candidatus Eiseniibacteriota bacterium]|nr:MAG: 4Fe-4S binding protein [Candidatus Eisenbacteria bacterium]
MNGKSVRKIIKIDEEKCNGCGLCVPSCAEGAIQIVDGKARLVSETFCDGLGACLGECPEGALEIVEREADEFDEEAVKAHLASAGAASAATTGPSSAKHAAAHDGAAAPGGDSSTALGSTHGVHAHGSPRGCPGSRMMHFNSSEKGVEEAPASAPSRASELRGWPVQLMLLPVNAPHFRGADLLVAADCTPFAYAGFHEDLLREKTLLVGCPKLDDVAHYKEKLTDIFRSSDVKSVTVAVMEVPCCSGLLSAVRQAIEASGKPIPMSTAVIGVRGELRR